MPASFASGFSPAPSGSGRPHGTDVPAGQSHVLLLGEDPGVLADFSVRLEAADDLRVTTLGDPLLLGAHLRSAADDVACLVAELSPTRENSMLVLDAVNQARPGLPVVFLFAPDAVDECREAILLGAHACLTTPVDVDLLVQTIRAAIRRAAAGESASGFREAALRLELTRQRHLLEMVSSMAKVGGWELDLRSYRCTLTDEAYSLTGLTHGMAIDVESSLTSLLGEEEQEIMKRAVRTALETGEPFDLRQTIHTGDGSARRIRHVGRVVREKGEPVRLVGAIQDVEPMARIGDELRRANAELTRLLEEGKDSLAREMAERRAAEDRARYGQTLLEQVLALVPMKLFVRDEEGVLLLASKVLADAYGVDADAIVGRHYGEIHQDKEECAFFLQKDREVLETGKPVFVPEETFTDADGTMGYVQVHKVPFEPARGDALGKRCVLGVAVDITERKRLEERLRQKLEQDELTGLANKSVTLARLEALLVCSLESEGQSYSVVLMDLYKFKLVTDSLGHAFGDALLKEVADRLARELYPQGQVPDAGAGPAEGPGGGHLLARFGGSAFVVVLKGTEPRQAVSIVRRLRDVLHEPFRVKGRTVRTAGCFGVVHGPVIVNGPEDLLHQADLAMHMAKLKGPGSVKVFTERMLREIRERLQLEEDLRRALARDEFVVEYQPVHALKRERLVGFEALVRWDHPEKGRIPPLAFIPLAEELGLIGEIGTRVMKMGLKQLARWQREIPGAEHLHLAVNLSSRQFSQSGLVRQTQAFLEAYGLAPESLVLEITESVFMEEGRASLKRMERLKELGIALSIDDFGTGYSSLAYLRRLPVDILKIDRSFIRSVTTDAQSREIVRSIIGLAHSLKLSVIAEGAEEAAHVSALKLLGSDMVQGYHFAKPLPPDEAFSYVLAHLGDSRQSDRSNASSSA